jgi:tRNA A-37 threonylcarbamoyl transferase component Bud32
MEQTKIPPRYRLIEEVGQGGMAVVFRAQDETLKREVAIKILHHHLATDSESKARLEREAQAVAKLRHENILEIFDYSGITSERAFIVTEFIDGKTLKEIFATRVIRHPEVAAMIAVEIGGALAHAHAVGIIHRDVKPENVMIRKDGLLKLTDFGIAQVVDLQRMTVTGQLLGSPAYMAPEVVEGKTLDFRTDVFSVGIILYQLATGALPFTGKNPHEVLRRIGEGKFADPRTVNRLIGGDLTRIMRRALARNPDDRYSDVRGFVTELSENLAEAGLTDPRAELRAFFADPDDYEAALPARLEPALIASAERQLAAHKTSRAMELWNRVLVIDPQQPQVLAALRRLEGRHRFKTAALAAVGLSACGIAAWGLARGRHAPLPPPISAAPSPPALGAAPRPPVIGGAPGAARAAATPPLASPQAPARPAVAPLPSASPLPAAAARPATAARVATAGGARPPRSDTNPGARPGAKPDTRLATAGGGARPSSDGAAPSRTFTLGPTPQNVDVYLDGDKQFAYDTDHQTISVPWKGNHVIEFRSPIGCCFGERIEIGPDRPLPPENIIARKLKWKPARIVITTEPASQKARVFVKDPSRHEQGILARLGEDVAVPFYPDDERSKEIEVDVDTGELFASERVTVRAGQRLSHVIQLRPNN